nr:MAG TPA: Protein of unknown function (DUF1071) [Caudoviricetes sp.]
MLKSFNELRKVDVSPYVDTRDGGLEYLNWAKCVDLLHENGAEVVYFEPLVNENGSSLFMSSQTFTDSKGNVNRCYEVAVRITIDDLQFVMRAPLMNGSNPVKDNSLSQQRVWNAQTRAFVKGVAIRTGLGFELWSKDFESAAEDDDLSKHDIFKIKERVQQEYTAKLKQKLTTKEIADKLDMTEDEVKVLFTYFDAINRFEQKLVAIEK